MDEQEVPELRSQPTSAPADSTTLARLLAQYMAQKIESSPIKATAIGIHDNDNLLDTIDPEYLAEQSKYRAQLESAIFAIDPKELRPLEALDARTALIDLAQSRLSDRNVNHRSRAAYWYTESLGGAISGIVDSDHAPIEERADALRQRLAAVPDFLKQAKLNLAGNVPELWGNMGVAGAAGIVKLIQASSVTIATDLSETLAADLEHAASTASESVATFGEWLKAESSSEHWACGALHFDDLLREVQVVDLDHSALYAYGEECVTRDRLALDSFAKSINGEIPWNEQIDRIKDDCPTADEFVATYKAQMDLARRQTIDHDLATIPPGEHCGMGLVPEYRRFELPIAVMDLSAPFAEGLSTQWSITPARLDATADQLLQHRRDNCFAFAESIAAHETYPGHHLQRVHHKLATSDSPTRRAFISPQFLEGWGLYVEDLFSEEGFYDAPSIQLFKLRNALWRSLRIVIDVGIHTGLLGFDDAVDLLCSEARMDYHMAQGEVRRYARHDNPTYPSSYVLGRDRFHTVRKTWMSRNVGSTLRQFHDTILGFGTLPLAVIEEHMLAHAD